MFGHKLRQEIHLVPNDTSQSISKQSLHINFDHVKNLNFNEKRDDEHRINITKNGYVNLKE